MDQRTVPTADPGTRMRPLLTLAAALSGVALLAGALAPTALGVGAGRDAATAPAPLPAVVGDNETIVDVAARLSPSVVTLQVTGERPESEAGVPDPFGGGFGGDGFLRGTGSGVIVSADGLILTNRHVVDDATTVEVILADGDRVAGEVVGVDTYTDLAVVRMEGDGYPAAELGDSSALRIGQLAIAIGSPLGEFTGSVSAGIVSGLDRSIEVGDPISGARSLRHLIQTDAAINPGNSGGVLADGAGRVIGINTAIAGNAEGIGFAIPIDIARPIVDQVMAGKKIARPWMGIAFRDLDAQVAEEEKLPVSEGAWVAPAENGQGTSIVEGSPAEKAGLREGDIILALDDRSVSRETPLDLLLLGYEPKAKLTLTILRDGEEKRLEIVLGTRPADLGR